MRRRAFTLVELLVVVSIIALLLAILLPSLSKARTQAKRTLALTRLHDVGVAMLAYATENRDQHPALIDREEKAFLGLSLLTKQYTMPRNYLNPATKDTPPTATSPDGRPVLADLDGVEITNDTVIDSSNIARVNFHCSFSYDNDVKNERNRVSGGLYRSLVFVGDRADYESGRTFSANWRGEGNALLWTDGHAEFRRKRSLPEQSDPNIYHHNEFEGEGADEISDGVAVTEHTIDTHERFFSEEEDDELLPNP